MAVMRKAMAAKLHNTGVPARHLKTKLEKLEPWCEKLDILSQKLNKGGITFALIGQRGTGKTQLAVELIRYAVSHNMECKYSRVMDFFTDVKATYHGNYMARTEGDVVQSYFRPQLLVLDEIQDRGATDWEDRLLTHMLDKRYGALKDTLLIGNQKPEVFASTIGNSILSRLMETGAIMECDWESFRAPRHLG